MKKRSPEKKITLEEVGESVAYIVKHMATKDDLTELRSELKGDMAELRSEFKEDMAELGMRTATLEKGQRQILDTLEPLSRAHDKDSEMLVEHGKRITHIEKNVGIRR